MDTRKINLFVYDTKENFEKSKQFLGEEGSVFKRLICIENLTDLERNLSPGLLNDDDYIYLVVHVFATSKISGIKRFLASGISDKYPKLGTMYISDGIENEIKHLMIDAEIPDAPVYKYHKVFSSLKEDEIHVYKKQEIIDSLSSRESSKNNAIPVLNEDYPQCDYAIITALEEDEMQQVLPLITKTGIVKNEKHLIEFGYLTTKPEKKIAYASQQAIGMIDAAILATELILRFQPKFLIMPGVLGGKPNEIRVGDIIVSTKVFTTDKGKLTIEKIDELSEPKVPLTKTIKKIFKREIESISLDSAYITKLKRGKSQIIDFIKKEDQTRKSRIDIQFGPIACVRQVIDQKGYFEENILIIDRKTIGLEMESYGISRACELVNDGKTTPLIIKAVMDNTDDKGDDAKAYAAWTSAMLLKYILENDLI